MAKNLGGLNYPANFEQGGTNGTDPNTARDNLGVSTETLEKNANYTTNLADRGLVIRFVGAGGYTLGLAPVGTLIDGWNVVVRNDSATNLLIEPDGSEIIDGQANLILEVGQAIIIYSDDIEFFTLGQASVPSGTGANVNLSNLSSVAINTSLISDTDITDDLGSLSIRWRDIFAESLSTGDTNGDSLKIRGYDVDGTAFVDFITITAGNTPTCVLHGTVTCTTQAPSTNNTTIASTAYVDAAVVAGAGAPANATYLLQTANGSLTNAQVMGALSTGLVKNTTTTGVQTIAIAGTDYLAPAAIGVTVQGYDAGLAALAVFNTNGYLVQTANNVFAGRTQTGTANEITVTNGDGVSGNTVYSLPAALTFTGKTITGGAYATASATSFTFTSGTIGTAVTGVTQAALTNNTTIATTQYVDSAVSAGGSGANTALSNLASVAINTSLISDTDITDDLGSASIRWRNLYVQSIQGAIVYGGIVTTSDLFNPTYDDFDPTGLSTCSILVLTANSSSPTITGLEGGVAGRKITLMASQANSFPIILADTNGGSASDNQFYFGPSYDNNNYVLNNGESIDLFHNGTNWRWENAGFIPGLNCSSIYSGSGAGPDINVLSRSITAPTITSNEIDYLPSNSTEEESIWHLDSSGDYSIGGIVAPADDAKIYILYNDGSNNITLLDEDPSSDSTFRFAILDDITMIPGTQVIIQYDLNAERWKLLSSTVPSASSGANTALSNLAAVAINTTLVSDTDVTDNLGTQAIRWNNIYAASLQTGDTAADVLNIGAWDVDGAAISNFITLTAGNTPTCALASGVTGVTQSASDNSTKLATTAYVDAATGGSGIVLQALQTSKTSTFSTSSTSFVDVTGMSQAITPASASSRFKITVTMMIGGSSSDATPMYQLVRDSTDIFEGDAATSRIRATGSAQVTNADGYHAVSFSYIDSPATASAVTYKVQMRAKTGTVLVNSSSTDTNSSLFCRGASSIIVEEYSA